MVEIASGRLAVLFGASALISAGLLWVLHPLLKRYALARPNARSSHRAPTPQGGGIAVVAATIMVAAGAFVLTPGGFDQPLRVAVILAGAVALAGVGAIDDIRPLGIWPRLLLQAVAVIVVLAALPAALRVMPWLPLWVERAVIFVGVLWFVNLVNFMDGIDWIDGRRNRAADGGAGLVRGDGRTAARRRAGCGRVMRRDGRLRAVQSPGGARVPRRRRQPAGRPAAGLDAGVAGRRRPPRGGGIAAALLPRRRDRHLAAAARHGRSGDASPSQPFLPARDRQVHRHAGGRPRYSRSTWCSPCSRSRPCWRHLCLCTVRRCSPAACWSPPCSIASPKLDRPHR